MKREELYDLIKPDLYQVFLLKSAVPVPFQFAMHGWFIINLTGDIHRWEFGRWGKIGKDRFTDVVQNYLPLTAGMNKYSWKLQPRAQSKMIHFIEGDKNSIAAKMAHFIHEKSREYPIKERYSYTGPNSNTYLQWVINHFPNAGFELPRNAVGKKYKVRQVFSPPHT